VAALDRVVAGRGAGAVRRAVAGQDAVSQVLAGLDLASRERVAAERRARTVDRRVVHGAVHVRRTVLAGGAGRPGVVAAGARAAGARAASARAASARAAGARAAGARAAG